MPSPAVHFNTPSVGETAATVIDDRIVFIRIAYDESADNPLDTSERLGIIYSFSTRHMAFIDHHRPGGPDAVREEFAEDAVFLSFFEHGQSWWGVMGGRAPSGVEFEWDGVRFAGVWIPTSALLQEADAAGETRGSPERRARMEAAAAKACEIQTAYTNGQVYSLDMSAYALLRVAGSNTPILTESLYEDQGEPLATTSTGGYFDDDALKRDIQLMGRELLAHPEPA
jgi:hypothetical protein